MRQPRNCLGSALISALFITAIAAVLATALAMQGRLLIDEGQMSLQADQLYLDLQSMQDQAKAVVIQYAAQFLSKVPPAQANPLPQQLPLTHLHSVMIAGTVDSELGKFNLNDLVYAGNQPRFVALLQSVLSTANEGQSVAIAQAITAWMMTGSDDQYYLSLHPAYRSSLNEFANISELKLIKGVTPLIYAKLKPYITALPVQKPQLTGQPSQAQTAVITPADINAVSAPVLMTLVPTLSPSQAAALVSCRGQMAFPTVQAFVKTCGAEVGLQSMPYSTTAANYFLVKIVGKYHDRVVTLKTLLLTKVKKNNTLEAVIVWQEFE